MNSNRKDLTTWVMHFIHDRNPENDPAYNINEGEATPLFPFHEDHQTNSRFELWEMSDEAHPIEPDASAFAVLLKIIEDGHIRSGWSFRNDCPTIYGPRSAVCFTEMPLYALLEYASEREDTFVNCYAIGLLKQELFAAGGRPVIYGLSGVHSELAMPLTRTIPRYKWPRKLDPSCELGEQEQYRYVATKLNSSRPIDWTHEREWRWADRGDACSCPGLPIFLKEEPHKFSQILIVVPTNDEASRVLDHLKELYDSGSHNYGHEYRKQAITNTRVVSLEEVSTKVSPTDLSVLRLDDIPSASIQAFDLPSAAPKLVVEVQDALKEAHTAASQAVDDFLKKAPRTPSGHVADVCGFAQVVIYEPQSPIVSALIELDEVSVIAGVGYTVSNFGSHGRRREQAMSVAEAGADAAKSVLEKRFPGTSFGVRTLWD